MKRYTHLDHPSKILTSRQALFWALILGLVFMGSVVWAHSDNKHDGLAKTSKERVPHERGHAITGAGGFALGETVYKHMCVLNIAPPLPVLSLLIKISFGPSKRAFLEQPCLGGKVLLVMRKHGLLLNI